MLQFHTYVLFSPGIWRIGSQHGDYFLGSSKAQSNRCWEPGEEGGELLLLAEQYVFGANEACFTPASSTRAPARTRRCSVTQRHPRPLFQPRSLRCDNDEGSPGRPIAAPSLPPVRSGPRAFPPPWRWSPLAPTSLRYPQPPRVRSGLGVSAGRRGQPDCATMTALGGFNPAARSGEP